MWRDKKLSHISIFCFITFTHQSGASTSLVVTDSTFPVRRESELVSLESALLLPSSKPGPTSEELAEAPDFTGDSANFRESSAHLTLSALIGVLNVLFFMGVLYEVFELTDLAGLPAIETFSSKFSASDLVP